jgi:PAS domain S-box-containing protein
MMGQKKNNEQLMQEVADLKKQLKQCKAIIQENEVKLNSLQESREKFRFISNNLQEGLWITDVNDIMTYIYPAMEKISGANAKDVIGLNILKDFPDETIQHFKEFYNKAKQSHKPVNYEAEVVTPADRKTIQAGWIIPRIADGEYKGIICTIQDITEQRKVEEELKASEEKYRNLVESSPDGVVLVNKLGKVVSINKSFLDATGYKKEDFEGKHFLKVPSLLKQDFSFYANIFKDLLLGKKIEPIEFKWKHADGQIRVGEAKTKIFRQDGKIVGIQAVLRDVTDRVAFQKAITESEEKYRNIVENSIQGLVVVTDNPVKINFASQPMEDILGYSPKELVSFNPEKLVGLVHPDDRERFFGTFQKRIKGENVPSRSEYKLLHKDQSIKWVELHSSIITTNGKAASQTVFIDITERKKAEELLENERKRFYMLLETFPGFIYLQAQDYTIKFANKYFKDVFGEYKNGLCHDIICKSKKPCVPCPTFEVFETKKSKTWEWNDPATGKVYMIYDHPFIDSDGTELVLEIGFDITEKKEKEELLKKNSLIIDSTTDLVITTDLNGVITFTNKAVTDLYKYDKNELIGKPVSILWKEEDTQDLQKLINELLEGKVINNLETYCLDKNKNEIPILMSLRGIKNGEGEIVELFGISKEIKSLKQTQDALKESEEKFRAFFNGISSGAAITKSLEQPFIVNQKFCDLLGYPKEELESRSINEIVNIISHPDDIEEDKKLFEEMVKGEISSYRLDKRFIKKNGEILFVDLTNALMRNEKGGFKFAFSTVTDITEKKHAEEKLKESEEKFRLLIENQTDMIVKVDLDNRFTFVSKSYCETFDKTEEELIGTTFVPLIHEDDKAPTLEAMKDLYRPPYRCYIEQRALTKEGYRWIAWKDSAILDENGYVKEIIGVGRDITEQKQAEKALKESEDFLNRTGEIARVGGWYLSDNFDKVYWTKTTGIIHELPDGYFPSLEEAINYYHPDDQALVRESVESAIKDGNPFDFETRLITAKGNEVWVQALGYPEMINGKCVRLSGTFQDITLRKKSELELQTNNSLLNATMESTTDGILVVDLQGRIVDYNERFLRIWNFDFETLKDGKIKNLVAPENKDFIMKHITSRLADPKAFITKVQELYKKPRENSFDTLRFIDGRIIERYSIPQVINNNPVGRVWSFRDVSVRKKAEKEILDISRRLKISTESAHIGIWDLNLQENFLVWDKRMFMLYGIKEESYESAYETWKKGVHPEDLERSDKEVQDAITGKKEFHTQFRVVWPDGQIRHIEAHALVIRDPDGTPENMIGVNWDITDSKLAEERLIEAKEKAEESDRLKSAFLANMSHEIRTPMNGILGFTNLLKTPDLKIEEQQEYVSVIEKSGNRLLNIINEIIDISKIESGAMELSIKEVDINNLLWYLYTFFKPEAQSKGMDLELQNTLPNIMAKIETDGDKVSAVMVNLIKNAIKYTNKGSVEFGCEVKEIQDAKFLQFSVKDTGIGIAPDRHEAIFERFVQADIGDVHARQGAGLGLAISKAYVEMLGGKIWLESEEDIGSTFYFTIPIIQAKEKNNVRQESENDQVSETPKLRIIVAEDDEASSKLISTVLHNHAREIIHAKTGTEAVELCRSKPNIDLILMDIRMPEIDGYNATRIIRQFNNDVVIIAQTAYGLSRDREKALEAGCNDYIAKPVNKAELLGLIKKYFKR